MSDKKYWQNFEELNQNEAEQKKLKKEFKEELPFEDLSNENIFNAKTPRRDFLKYMGFSTAAAALAASCEMPVRKVIPFLHKPDDMIPGISNYYASTYINDGDAVPVVVKQREGRPIKIEGNDLSSLTNGGTSAQCQSSVLDLYDTTRLRYPQANGKEATFEAIDKMLAAGLTANAGKPVVLLTSSITSPSTKQIISEFLAKYPGSRHVQYDAVSYSGMILANEASYGKKAIPAYHFENAKVIVSLGADFLTTWLSPVVFANQYAQNRRIDEEKPSMSKHFQFESHYSITGANADERYLHKPSETGAVALALLGALGGGTSSNISGKVAEGIKKAAAELSANKGAALVVCGSNDPNIQIIVNAINEAIGAGGKTIDWNTPVNYRQGIDADVLALTNDLNAGNVGALLVYGANPAYSFFAADKFIAGVKKCPFTVSYSEKMDETTELCKYIVPSHHWLECWGDAEMQTGYVSVIQPIIHPLFKTRQFESSLLKLTGNANDYEAYFRNYWITKLGSVENFEKFLQDGVIENSQLKTQSAFVNVSDLTSATAGVTSAEEADSASQKINPAVPLPVMSGATFSGNVADAASKISSIKGGETEMVLYQKVSIGTGSRANNAWLQEVSDPISKATWDNYAMISPQMGKSLFGVDIFNRNDMDKYEVHIQKPIIKVTVNGKTIEIPILIMPGIHPNVIAMAVGYGRQSINKDKTAEYIGPAANGVGVNVYPLAYYNGTTVIYSAPVTIENTGDTYPIAQTQVHQITEGRPVVRETTLANFIARPGEVQEEREKELKKFGESFERDGTLYPVIDKPGIKWGMSIDLNTCIGCSACTVACVAENNISTVGKYEVSRFHDMQWIRIDRYFTGDPQNPDIVFQPMTCQQCDNAPCENVCPVSATNHSSEGINQMVYNRCIGTKYCANNCPYKVRRFNWADYNGADSFPDNQRGIISDATTELNADLERMVLNPDVTVRSRGVMEKCSFCVQRCQEGKLNAKKEDRPLKDMEVKTACMQACPTHAIVFGNVNDKDSQISKLRARAQNERKFYVLEELHTLPNVNYLEKIRNTDRRVGSFVEKES
ncbi:4Fe-4S dicluster domain-containing protein [Ginsengibacter hankyongi]|uniref:4Fe-4S dicluster domain-containing protein n=1 Tax=Ginsengibacter hankyongi TaxID=2607284 RepID=A0A5J5ILN4_9BACT|nr:TAT-variant-translocated molybdopterin oxidoreductase [Ginsengibacter hankyongi]KAA9042025.1 4Fe-4S dicluster domain-containing protein [Ginsengibacter hankyongi]